MGRSMIDETGKKYHRLTVIGIAPLNKYPRGAGKPIVWECKCDCGKTVYVPGRDLRSGRVFSCGCYAQEKAAETIKQTTLKIRHNFVGERFGKLTVLESSEQKSGFNCLWKCQCDCGNITYVRGQYLTSGHTTSCGCNRMLGNTHHSHGEQVISKILQDSCQPFQVEYTFQNLKGFGHTNLRFDFAVFQDSSMTTLKFLCEFDGEQHFKKVNFIKDEQQLQKYWEYDRIKNSYCLSHNIPLYRIPFFDINKINCINDILQEKYLVKTRWHNDEIRHSVFPKIPKNYT